MENKVIKQLIQQFGKLPTIHSRQSKKIISNILEGFADQIIDINNMIHLLEDAKNKTWRCKRCSNVNIDDECLVCKRDNKFEFKNICVVENLYELWRMLSITSINFSFHILGGVISATSGISPDMLNINNLLERIYNEEIEEIIIALNKSYNASLTTNYLANLLKKKFPNLKISTLADGLPSGADLDYIDDKTLEIAINSRVLC